MQIAHLRTLLAIRRSGSLTGAAREVHLSHSAVSVQMKQLEDWLGAELFIRGRRPAKLTPLGEKVAAEAQAIVERADGLRALAGADDVAGRVAIGFVPTTLETLLPVALDLLREGFPRLQVAVRSGLSAALAADVEAGELDFAFLSDPAGHPLAVRLSEIGQEPLCLIMPPGTVARGRVEDLLRANPYIAFSRATWLGRGIAGYLTGAGMDVDPAFELDSIDAIETLVARGFGLSIVPQRLMAPPLGERLRVLPLGPPAPARRIMLASSRHCRRQSVEAALAAIASPGQPPITPPIPSVES